MISTPVMLVFFRAAAAARPVRYARLTVLARVGTLRHDKTFPRLRRFRDFIVQRLTANFDVYGSGTRPSKASTTSASFGIRMVVRDDLAISTSFWLRRAEIQHEMHLQQFQPPAIAGIRANDSGGLVRRIAAASARLGDRLKDAQTNAFGFPITR